MKKQSTIKELSHDYFRRGQLGLVSPDSESAYAEAMKFSQEFVRFQTEIPEIKEKPYYIICRGVLNNRKTYYEIFSVVPEFVTKENLFEAITQFRFTHWRPLFYN